MSPTIKKNKLKTDIKIPRMEKKFSLNNLIFYVFLKKKTQDELLKKKQS